MAFGIEYFVGAGRGGWAVSSERFASEDAAKAEIAAQVAEEEAWELTPMMRRPVEVG